MTSEQQKHLPALPADAYPPDSRPIPVRYDQTRRLALSWAMLVLAWPVYEIADSRNWYAVLGLVVIVRGVALWLGMTAIMRLRLKAART